MKKFLTFLMLLCIVCTGAWAQDFTVASTTTNYNAIQVGHYYAFKEGQGNRYFFNGSSNKTETLTEGQIYKIVAASTSGKVLLQCYGGTHQGKYVGVGDSFVEGGATNYNLSMVESQDDAVEFTIARRDNDAQVRFVSGQIAGNASMYLGARSFNATNPAQYQVTSKSGALSFWNVYEVTIPSLQIDVTVSYKHGDNVLGTDTPKYYAGTYTFLSREISGYKCRVESQEVTIDAENHTVEFQYDKYFDVTVEGKYGETVLWSETQSRLDIINAFTSRIVPGYACSEVTKDVSITGAGQTVTFNYDKAQAIKITNYTSAASTRLTVEQFKSLKGTGAHFAMHSTQQESWSTFAASDTHQSDVSVDYMFTLAEGSQPNTYWIKNFAGETMTAAGGGNVPTFEQDGTGFDWSIIQSPTSASKFDADKQVRFCNGEGQNYAAHYKQFGDYPGDWGRYVTYGPFYMVTIQHKNGEEILGTSTGIYSSGELTVNANYYDGYVADESSVTTTIDHDMTITLNYQAEAIPNAELITTEALARENHLLTYEQFMAKINAAQPSGRYAFRWLNKNGNQHWRNLKDNTASENLTKEFLCSFTKHDSYWWITNYAGQHLNGRDGNGGTFGETGVDFNITNDAVESGDLPTYFTADNEIRFKRASDNNYYGYPSSGTPNFGTGNGGYMGFAAYGPFYTVTIHAKYNGEEFATKTLIYSKGVNATISVPRIAHYYSTDADMTGVEIFEDKDIDFNYQPVTYTEPQEGHVYRIKNILKTESGTADRTNVLFNDIDANNRISSQIFENDAAVNGESYYAPKYYFVAQEVTEDHVTFASALGTTYAGALNNSNTNTVAKMQAAQEKVQFEYTSGPIAGTIAFKVGDNYIAGCRGYADRFIYRTENAAYLEGPQGVKYSTAFQLEDVTDRFEGYAANMTTELSNGIYGTLNLPYNSVVPEGVEAYIFTAKTDEGEISFARKYGAGDILPANEPVLLCTETAGSYKFLPTEDSASASEDNLFSGTLCKKDQNKGEAEFNSDIYVLGKNAANCFTFMHTSSATINSNKAYIDLSTMEPEVQSLVRGFSFELNGGTITAISGAHARIINKESTPYDLQGRRLQSLVKGVNIVSGRKVLK